MVSIKDLLILQQAENQRLRSELAIYKQGVIKNTIVEEDMDGKNENLSNQSYDQKFKTAKK
jgi:hypothetical protein